MIRSAIATLAFLAVAIAAPGGQEPAEPAPRVIYVVAERFSFTPSTITVEQGTRVELRITSDDTSHGFRLTGLTNVNIEIPKRGRGDVRVTFEAKEPGKYTFDCSRVCGAGHGFMRGTIRVKPRPAQAQDPR